MDPGTVASAIVAALSAGGAFVGQQIGSEALKDAYGELKTRLINRYPAVGIDHLEKQPVSEARRAVLVEDLEREGASNDVDFVQLAWTVVELIREEGPDLARSIGVDLGELDRANVTFGNVFAGKDATGVRIQTVSGSSLAFGDVIASSEGEYPKKA